MPYTEFGKRNKVFARHRYPHVLGISHEMEKTEGGVIWVAKEFKSRPDLRFDLHLGKVKRLKAEPGSFALPEASPRAALLPGAATGPAGGCAGFAPGSVFLSGISGVAGV